MWPYMTAKKQEISDSLEYRHVTKEFDPDKKALATELKNRV